MRHALPSLLTGVAGAILIVAIAILPFLTPQWVAFEQGRAEATAWTGYTADELNTATAAILSDLVFGPPAFEVDVSGEPVLNERERGHLRDVRSVFVGLWIAAVLSVVVVGVAFARRDRRKAWLGLRRGALGLAAAIVGLGLVAVVAFDVLFEVFHRIVFAGGSYTFDPSTERLVQLFPFRFWQETAIAAGVVIILLSLLTAAVASRRTKAAPLTTTLAASAEVSR